MKPATIERNKDASKKLVPFTLSLDMRQYAEGEAHSIPDAIHVAPIGKWDHPLYGEFEVTRETVRETVDGGQDQIRPLKIRFGVDDEGQIDGIGNGGEVSDAALFAEGKVGLEDGHDAVDADSLEFTGLTAASAVVVAATPAM
jgi:hypothetical protein